MADINVDIVENPISVTLSGNVIGGFVNADNPFYLNGFGGDTYFIYDSASSTLQLWVNGVQVKQWS